MNKLLTYLTTTGSFGAIVGALGDLAQMRDRRYEVKYTGGAPDATWRWAVGLPISWANVSLNSLGGKASAPGVPYQALRHALGLYNNESIVVQQPSSELSPAPGRLLAAGPLDSNYTKSPNVTNIIHNITGLPIGTYGLWEQPGGGGQYAVWKLQSFMIKVSLSSLRMLQTLWCHTYRLIYCLNVSPMAEF